MNGLVERLASRDVVGRLDGLASLEQRQDETHHLCCLRERFYTLS